ncbi:hypothetical protein R1flu_005856 [Riccia fluitans]|uniref:Uncharacterized protein n=1 Tax=Riccia fluitans TaxID=41844 RepID=A0ABD1YXD2_9MARC
MDKTLRPQIPSKRTTARTSFDWMDGLTYSAVRYITREIKRMKPNQRAAAFQNNSIMAHHFPHLDPRNLNSISPVRGPVLPLDRQLLASFLRRWTPQALERYFHICPWMRHRFPEFAPPGGWPDTIFTPVRFNNPGPTDPVHDPAQYCDPELHNFAETTQRTRTPSNLPPAPRAPDLSPGRVSEAAPSMRSTSASPSRNIPGNSASASPFSNEGPSNSLNQHAFYRYFDPTRYGGWGDVEHGFIAVSPDDPIDYRILYPTSDVTHRTGDVAAAIDPLVHLDYNLPGTREYPVSPFDFVWDDNFTPTEQKIVGAP